MIDPSESRSPVSFEARRDCERFERNLLAERDSAALYEALATLERDAEQAGVYRRLAASEREHAEYWRLRLHSAGYGVPRRAISLRTRLLIHLARWLGSAFVIPAIAVRERSDHESYAGQKDAAEAGLAIDEHGHAETLRAMTGGTVGTNLRAAILGANDGLASNLCLIMGVIGGGATTSAVLLTGIAGLVAGSLSMALGEWLSVTNARELADSLKDREARQLHHPRGREPLGTSARRHGSSDPDDALPGASPKEAALTSGEAWGAARFSLCLFAVGAAMPVLPFVLLSGTIAIAGSIALSIAALGALGLATSLFSGRSPGFSAARQVAIGIAVAIVTYGVGRLFAMAIL